MGVVGLGVKPPHRTENGIAQFTLDMLVYFCETGCPNCHVMISLVYHPAPTRELECIGTRGGCGWTGYLVL